MHWNLLNIVQFIALANNNCIHVEVRFKIYFENYKAKAPHTAEWDNCNDKACFIIRHINNWNYPELSIKLQEMQ